MSQAPLPIPSVEFKGGSQYELSEDKEGYLEATPTPHIYIYQCRVYRGYPGFLGPEPATSLDVNLPTKVC